MYPVSSTLILRSCTFAANKAFRLIFLSFYRVEIEFPTTLYRYDAGRHSATGNRVPKAIADKKRALGNVIMPRQSRDNTTEEKRRMRNERRKRKQLSRTTRERENREMRIQKERDAYSRAKGRRECIMANGKH